MTNIYDWADEWNIPEDAMESLFKMLQVHQSIDRNGDHSEGHVQSKIRLEAANKGMYLWRNNSGAFLDKNGNFVRFGLCNDSAKMNEVIKSADLIGGKPVTITQDMVGKKIMQFVAREVKKSDWKFSKKDKRAMAQLKFISLVQSLGGDACFANAEGTL